MRSGLDSVPGRRADDAVARVVELVREDSLQATGRYSDVKNAVVVWGSDDQEVRRSLPDRPQRDYGLRCMSRSDTAIAM